MHSEDGDSNPTTLHHALSACTKLRDWCFGEPAAEGPDRATAPRDDDRGRHLRLLPALAEAHRDATPPFEARVAEELDRLGLRYGLAAQAEAAHDGGIVFLHDYRARLAARRAGRAHAAGERRPPGELAIVLSLVPKSLRPVSPPITVS